MNHQVIAIGDQYAEAELAPGISVELQSVSGGEAVIGENTDITENEYKKIYKLKTRKGKDKLISDIISTKDKNNESTE